MARTAAKITQADVARVLRAIGQTGVAAEVIVEPNGRIRIVPCQEGGAKGEQSELGGTDEIRL
jgi:hypothetical protein